MFEDLMDLLNKQPFEAFNIVTNSGKVYMVENPRNVAVSKTRISIFPPRTDEWVLIRLTEISALESVQKAA